MIKCVIHTTEVCIILTKKYYPVWSRLFFNNDCTTISNSYLVGLPAFMLQKFPRYSKNKKNYTEIICVKHVTANPCISEDWLLTFWPIHREQEVCQIWDWWNINNISFHFRSFPRKTFEFSINFWKNPYKTIFEPIWALFAQIWSKMNFLGKEGSSSF